MKRNILNAFIAGWLLVAAISYLFASCVVHAQESVQLPTPIFQGYDNNGDPCDGCKLYVFQSGTLVQATTYSNRARTTANEHPVILDSAGRAVLFVPSNAIYDMRLDSDDDVQIWSMAGVGLPATPLFDFSNVASTDGVDIELDTDNNAPNAFFRVINGLGVTVFSVDEAGVVTSSIAVGVGDGTISTAKLIDEAVTRPKIGIGAVGPDQVDGLRAADIQSGTFGTNRVGALDASDIVTGSFGPTRICTGTPSADDVCRGNGTWGDVPEASGPIDNARLSGIPRTALLFGVGEASHSGESSTVFIMHDYALPAAAKYNLTGSGAAGDGFQYAGEGASASDVDSFTSYITRGRFKTERGGTGRAIWRYLAGSDMPSVWVLLGDDREILAMFEAEDPVRDGDATSPISKPVLDDDGQPTGVMLGRDLNIGLPSHAVIAALYDALDTTQQAQFVANLSDYVVAERGWLDSLTALSGLQQIETRYEPSGRQWAMRCAANAAVGRPGCDNAPVTAFYQTHLRVSASDAWELR